MLGFGVHRSSRLPHRVSVSFSGIGGSVKPQKPGEPHPVPMSLSSAPHRPSTPTPAPLTHSCSVSPGLSSRNGLGAGAFPGVGAQPGEGTWGPRKEGGGGQKLDFLGENKGWEGSTLHVAQFFFPQA